jgi:hypothetical protein
MTDPQTNLDPTGALAAARQNVLDNPDLSKPALVARSCARHTGHGSLLTTAVFVAPGQLVLGKLAGIAQVTEAASDPKLLAAAFGLPTWPGYGSELEEATYAPAGGDPVAELLGLPADYNPRKPPDWEVWSALAGGLGPALLRVVHGLPFTGEPIDQQQLDSVTAAINAKLALATQAEQADKIAAWLEQPDGQRPEHLQAWQTVAELYGPHVLVTATLNEEPLSFTVAGGALGPGSGGLGRWATIWRGGEAPKGPDDVVGLLRVTDAGSNGWGVQVAFLASGKAAVALAQRPSGKVKSWAGERLSVFDAVAKG